MKTSLIILIFLAIIALTALTVWYASRLEKSRHKTFNIILTITGAVLIMILLLGITKIPSSTDKILTTGIAQIKTQLESLNPGSTDTDMDATQFKAYLNKSQDVSDYLINNEYAGFLTRTFGVRYYIKMFNIFANNLDDNMKMFEEAGNTFSVNNILNYVKEQTVKPVLTATKILEIVVATVAALFLLIMFIWAASIKKGKISKGVTFGETTNMTNNPFKLHNTKTLILLLLTSILGTTSLYSQNPPTGAINGLFSINDTTQVCFSQGNLQYQASTNTWRFAENQWDYVGEDNANISPEYDGWIDLFGWGTSGYDHGAVCYQPWGILWQPFNYYAYGDITQNLYNQTGQADWGYNAISNGGNIENQWRTLTISEYTYLFYTREIPSGIRFAKAQVNEISGMILLPDDWSSEYYELVETNNGEPEYNINIISQTDWMDSFEANGAIFLPAAGWRYETSLSYIGMRGRYWTANVYDDTFAYDLFFLPTNLQVHGHGYRQWGCSVRLVTSSGNYTYNINATPNPEEGGAIYGAGEYRIGDDCTLTAMANEFYVFESWTENDEIVSTDAQYTFIVDGERNLVANFKNCESIDENLDDMFKVYPNPANDIIVIESSGRIYKFEVYNTSGQLVELISDCIDKKEINVSSLSKGVYIIRCVIDGKALMRKLIIR